MFDLSEFSPFLFSLAVKGHMKALSFTCSSLVGGMLFGVCGIFIICFYFLLMSNCTMSYSLQSRSHKSVSYTDARLILGSMRYSLTKHV